MSEFDWVVVDYFWIVEVVEVWCVIVGVDCWIELVWVGYCFVYGKGVFFVFEFLGFE